MYRVGGTRVTLDIVVRAFNRGATAEEIVQEFPSLQLPDVYQVIGYYLKHSAEFAAYFEKREREEKELLTRTSGRPGDCVSACWRAGRIREVAGGRDSQERAGSDAKPKQKLGVAVGIAVARYPPHRSVRADFPHPAPTSDDGVRANGSTHALQPLGHASAALCRSHVWLSDVLLGLRPSLQALRGWLPSLVRTLHWYYTRVRLLARVPVGLLALAFSHRSAAGLRRRCGPGLPVLVHDVSGRARGLGVSAPVRVVFAVCYRIDTLEFFFHSSIPGPPVPLSTLRPQPHD